MCDLGEDGKMLMKSEDENLEASERIRAIVWKRLGYLKG